MTAVYRQSTRKRLYNPVTRKVFTACCCDDEDPGGISNVVSVNQSSLSLRWGNNTGGSLSDMAVGGGYVFVGGPHTGDNLFMYNEDTGVLVDSIELAGVPARILDDGGTIYVKTQGELLYKIAYSGAGFGSVSWGSVLTIPSYYLGFKWVFFEGELEPVFQFFDVPVTLTLGIEDMIIDGANLLISASVRGDDFNLSDSGLDGLEIGPIVSDGFAYVQLLIDVNKSTGQTIDQNPGLIIYGLGSHQILTQIHQIASVADGYLGYFRTGAANVFTSGIYHLPFLKGNGIYLTSKHNGFEKRGRSLVFDWSYSGISSHGAHGHILNNEGGLNVGHKYFFNPGVPLFEQSDSETGDIDWAGISGGGDLNADAVPHSNAWTNGVGRLFMFSRNKPGTVSPLNAPMRLQEYAARGQHVRTDPISNVLSCRIDKARYYEVSAVSHVACIGYFETS